MDHCKEVATCCSPAAPRPALVCVSADVGEEVGKEAVVRPRPLPPLTRSKVSLNTEEAGGHRCERLTDFLTLA